MIKSIFVSICFIMTLSVRSICLANQTTPEIENAPEYQRLMILYNKLKDASCDQSLIRPLNPSAAHTHASDLAHFATQLMTTELVDFEIPIQLLLKVFPKLMPYEVEDYLIDFILRHPTYYQIQLIFSRIDHDRGCKNDPEFLEKIETIKALIYSNGKSPSE